MEVSSRKSYFIEEDDDLASSLSEMEAGFSGSHSGNCQNGVVSCPLSYSRMNSLRNTNYCHNNYTHGYYYHQYSVSSPRSVVPRRFHDFRLDNQQTHYLDSCSLCKKPLHNRDIFMYRGDTPFCSEECREEQIEKDEAEEKKKNLSYSVKSAMRRKEQRSSSSSSPTRSGGYAFHNGTVAAA